MKFQICFMKTRCISVLNLNVNIIAKLIFFFSNVIKDQLINGQSPCSADIAKRDGSFRSTDRPRGVYIWNFHFKKRHILLCRKSYFTAENNSWFLCSCLETCLVLIIFNGDEYVYLRKYFGLERKKEGAFGFACLHNSNFSWYSWIYCDSWEKLAFSRWIQSPKRDFMVLGVQLKSWNQKSVL